MIQDRNDPNHKDSWIETLFESLSLTGAIVFMFFTLTVTGVVLEALGHPSGEKVWQNFGTALTTFVSGKKLADYERRNKDGENK